MFTARVRCWFQPRAAQGVLRGWLLALACLLAAAGPARADGLELGALTLARGEEGLLVDYQARVELPRAVEDALLKGVPLYFQARVEVFRERWYWRDDRVARATRNWRLTWQPLTRRYRINYGSLSQNYDTLADALGAIQRGTRWRVATPEALADGADYLQFVLRLDTSQLPRPLQIGFGGEADWDLAVERRLGVPEAGAAAASASSAGPEASAAASAAAR